jgi:uncharacterized protein YuzE
MKIRYFPNTDTLSIRLNNKPSLELEEIADDVVVDFDANGNVVGIEIDLASSKVDLNFETIGLTIPMTAARQTGVPGCNTWHCCNSR